MVPAPARVSCELPRATPLLKDSVPVVLVIVDDAARVTVPLQALTPLLLTKAPPPEMPVPARLSDLLTATPFSRFRELPEATETVPTALPRASEELMTMLPLVIEVAPE